MHLHPLRQAQVVRSCPGLEGREVGNSVADRTHPDLVEEARHNLEGLVVVGHIEVGSAEEDSLPGSWQCLWVEGGMGEFDRC